MLEFCSLSIQQDQEHITIFLHYSPLMILLLAVASVHIPFFLDGNATYNLNGVQYIDGSLWDFISGDNSELLKCDGAACILDYVSIV